MGLEIDKNLSFDEHVSNICKNAGRKLSLSETWSSHMNLKQRRIFLNNESFYRGAIWLPLIILYVLWKNIQQKNYLPTRALTENCIDKTKALFMDCLKKTTFSLLTVETCKVWVLNYTK